MPTNYPASIDSLPRPASTTLMNDAGFEGDVVIDNLSDAVEAIQNELGTDPAGAQATVKARLEHVSSAGVLSGGAVWPSGGWVTTNLTGLTTTTATAAADWVYYTPWWCPRDVTLDRIAVEVSTLQPGANARLAIYESTTDNAPGSLLLDAGEIDCSTAGVKELTISQSVLGGKLYWLALLNETASVVFYATAAGAAGAFMRSGGTGRVGGSRLSVTRTYTSGVESPASGVADLSSTNNPAPVFFLRRT